MRTRRCMAPPRGRTRSSSMRCVVALEAAAISWTPASVITLTPTPVAGSDRTAARHNRRSSGIVAPSAAGWAGSAGSASIRARTRARRCWARLTTPPCSWHRPLPTRAPPEVRGSAGTDVPAACQPRPSTPASARAAVRSRPWTSSLATTCGSPAGPTASRWCSPTASAATRTCGVSSRPPSRTTTGSSCSTTWAPGGSDLRAYGPTGTLAPGLRRRRPRPVRARSTCRRSSSSATRSAR